jgi:hypothetical protein
VNALTTFENLDKSIDADSDSDDELAEQQHAYKCMPLKIFHCHSTNPLQWLAKEANKHNSYQGLTALGLLSLQGQSNPLDLLRSLHPVRLHSLMKMTWRKMIMIHLPIAML